jgi:hypothetical protein
MQGYAKTYTEKTLNCGRKRRAKIMIKSLHALEIILKLSS